MLGVEVRSKSLVMPIEYGAHLSLGESFKPLLRSLHRDADIQVRFAGLSFRH
jgi:hypothetical protein